MTKYKITWLPGDGIGNDVMHAARIVLDKIQLDSEYLPGYWLEILLLRGRGASTSND